MAADFGTPAAGASGFDPERLEALCLRNLLASRPAKFYFKDLGSRFVRMSSGHATLFRAGSAEELYGKTDFDFFTDEHANAAFEAEQHIIASGEELVDFEERETWPDRPDTWVLTSKMPLRDEDGQIIGTFGMSVDITERKQLASELARTEADLRRLLESSPDAMIRYDTQLRHVYDNPAALTLLRLSADDVHGRTDRELGFPPEVLDEVEPALRRVLAEGIGSQVEFATPGAEPLWLQSRMVPEIDEHGDVVGAFTIVRDLTDRKRAEEALAAQAVQDPLTGLANRVLLADRLQQSLVRLEREPGRLAVLFLDLDRFKVINDSLGHAAGDELLLEVAERLRGAARRSDTVARFGGDEFVILCDRVTASEDAAVIAARVSRVLAEPFTVGRESLHVSGSIGIAVTEDPGTTADDLLRDADAAMYQAKERGRRSGSFQFFDAGVRERAVARMTMEGQLRSALENQELCLHYQPLVTLQGERRLLGFEALIRWQHPDRGLLSPDAFLPVAEDTNLIVPIGRWVLDEACRQIAEWNQERPVGDELGVSVNVSARQLGHSMLTSDVAGALSRHGLPARLLTLELTETALLEEATVSEAVLSDLSALGVRLALDDFGTGYSSLGHLRRFPVDILKIDRSFVDGLGEGGGDAAIVAAVTALAHAMGMTTVGEGIETDRQLQALQELGCDDGQGYLVARPLTPDQVRSLL
jgi:diguanylate cyclase (GGDEF)-like protein/PAS domain S-box-containing protein